MKQTRFSLKVHNFFDTIYTFFFFILFGIESCSFAAHCLKLKFNRKCFLTCEKFKAIIPLIVIFLKKILQYYRPYMNQRPPKARYRNG